MTTGRLVLVGTPIGHDDDWSDRARQVLGAADVIAAEDTRVARSRLGRVGVEANRIVSLHDHNERQRVPQLVRSIEEGQCVAVISDAGMPLVSDPGYRLVRAVIEADLKVDVVPGPSAVLAGLAVSGLPPDRFAFLGFPPRTAARRRSWLKEVVDLEMTLVLFEAPHRLVRTLSDVDEVFGDRPLCVAFSLTKVWQRMRRGTAAECIARWADDPEDVKGEVTLVIGGANPREEGLGDDVERLVDRLAAAGVSPGVIRDAVADVMGVPRREVYQRALLAGTVREDELGDP